MRNVPFSAHEPIEYDGALSGSIAYFGTVTVCVIRSNIDGNREATFLYKNIAITLFESEITLPMPLASSSKIRGACATVKRQSRTVLRTSAVVPLVSVRKQ